MTTFGRQLAAHRGIGPGFDGVRLALASAVLFVHRGLAIPGGVDPRAPLVGHLPVANWAFDTLPVPLFFALSGFLVAASAERLPVGRFLLNRALRLFPALWLATLVAALVLGPMLTRLPLRDYVSDPLFGRYFLNFAALVRYDLPGLFGGNPEPGVVNGSLWTVPQEIICYLLLATATACGLLRRRGVLLALSLALCVASIVVAFADRRGIALPHGEALTYLLVTRGAARLVPFFLAGALAYLYRERIPYGGVAAAAAALLGYAGLCAFAGPGSVGDPVFTLVSAPLLTYAVISAGLSPKLRLRLPGGGDYSYGIYLYGFPLQQAIVALMPGPVAILPFMAASALATGALAVASWHLVERPALDLRRRLSGFPRGRPATPVGAAESLAAPRDASPALIRARPRAAGAATAGSG